MKTLPLKPITGLFLVALLSLLLSGCGWHLRGSNISEGSGKSIYLMGMAYNPQLASQLKRDLSVSNNHVVENATEADMSLVLVDYRSKRRTGTINVSARVSEYLLTERATIKVLGQNGHILLGDTTMRVERYYDFDENDVQSKHDEEGLIKEEMRKELSRQIIARLNALGNVRPTEESSPTDSSETRSPDTDSTQADAPQG